MKLKALVLPTIAGLAVSMTAYAGARDPRETNIKSVLQDICPPEACPAQTVGTIEQPTVNLLVSGYVRVKGFALDGSLVSNVDLFIDGTEEVNRVTAPGGANINLPRPDVTVSFPTLPVTLTLNSGFEMSFKAANYSNGTHTLYVRITDVTGCCYFLAPRTVRVDNGRNQAPFGEIISPDQTPDQFGVIHVIGWALDDRRVDHVDVFLDGRLERQAVTGIFSPEAAAKYPDAPNNLTAGFVDHIDSTKLDNGVHRITVKAVDDQGQQGLLGDRQIQVFNNSANLAPFGDVEYPLENATWFGNCFFQLPPQPSPVPDIQDVRFLQYVTGWALDTSVFADAAAVQYIQMEVDGVVIKDTRVNCHRELQLNFQLIDCYGYYRPDVEILYPGFHQAPNAGFFFAVDVGYLLTVKGLHEGAHKLQFKAADKEDQIREFATRDVIFECATGTLDPPPICYVDDPYHYKYISGVYPVLGWSLDLDNVVKVRIEIDGVTQIDAVSGLDYAQYGLPSPDVFSVYPNFPQAGHARWRFYLDTTKLSNSEHDLSVEVVDGRNNVRDCGTRKILVDNNTLVR